MASNHLQPAASPPPPRSPGGTQAEDWDRWIHDTQNPSQNSVQFPGTTEQSTQDELPRPSGSAQANRTLSELLRIHAERGTDVNFSPEEADRVAEVLGQWINSSSSPYEADDDFFSSQPHSQDDSSLPSRKRLGACDMAGRPRGQSESVAVVRVSS
ncbi:hypothetical protein BC835DRAFT_1020652 [Cytidiella melzeri]|nr:hypothetical protein BC835DRAFT_1020652 [Cytidiella melzeri]